MINLLDGLRDLKAPLASGLIILFGFWLIFANEIASAGPSESLAGNIHRLVGYLGGPATLGLVAFLGYIVGLVLSLHVMYRTLDLFIWKRMFALYKKLAKNETTSAAPRDYSFNTLNRLNDHIRRILRDAQDTKGWTDTDIYINISNESSSSFNWSLVKPSGDSEVANKRPENMPEIIDRLRHEITADIDLLAVQLHAEKDKIYEKYDKNKTESDFRAAVILPMVFVAVILMIRFQNESQTPLAILTLILALLLWSRLGVGAQQRLIEANEAVLNSLVVGHIKSPRMLAFEQPRLREPDGGTSFSTTAA